MMYLEDGIQMTTIFGDGSQARGDFIDKLVGAGKRLLTGESLFMTVFQNQALSAKKAAFAAPYPGKIQAMHLAELGGELIAQKESFLVAAKGVTIGIAFQKRFVSTPPRPRPEAAARRKARSSVESATSWTATEDRLGNRLPQPAHSASLYHQAPTNAASVQPTMRSTIHMKGR